MPTTAKFATNARKKSFKPLPPTRALANRITGDGCVFGNGGRQTEPTGRRAYSTVTSSRSPATTLMLVCFGSPSAGDATTR